MSVTVESAVFYRGYNGWQEQQYPIAYWWAASEGTGDATGGQLNQRFIFNRLGDPRNSRLYSLEYYNVGTVVNNNVDAILVASGFQGPGASSLGNVWAMETRINIIKTALRAAAIASDYQRVPVFMGGQEIIQLGDQALSLLITNPNGSKYTFDAGGYVWGPRSILANGGPQRPPGGLYGV